MKTENQSYCAFAEPERSLTEVQRKPGSKGSLTSMKIAAMYFIAFLIFASGCSSSSEDSTFTFGKGKYNFVMYDSTGSGKLIEGKMTVENYDGEKISGKLEYTKVYDEDFNGYSSMSDIFEGNVIKKDRKVWVNTNPRIADSNVFWNMTIGKTSVNGEWTYSVFRGQGSFKGKVKLTKAK